MVMQCDPIEMQDAARKAHCVLTSEAKAIKAIDNDGNIQGVVMYDGWTKNSVQIHVYLGTPDARRALMNPAFEYPFIQADRGVLLGAIPADNTRSLRLAQRVGFRETHRIRDAWAENIDLVLVEMRRDEWLKNRKAV